MKSKTVWILDSAYLYVHLERLGNVALYDYAVVPHVDLDLQRQFDLEVH